MAALSVFGVVVAAVPADHLAESVMAIPFPQPRYMPCADCGAALERGSEEKHVCERARLIDFQMIQLRDEFARIDGEVGEFLDTPRGRFEVWWAERERRERGGA
jgi:hypothetical protein